MLIIWVCRVWDVWEEKKPVKIEIDCIYGFLCCPICSSFGFGIYGTWKLYISLAGAIKCLKLQFILAFVCSKFDVSAKRKDKNLT